jgi:small nuclear ribonucleoprotein (snRNP)-like protein
MCVDSVYCISSHVLKCLGLQAYDGHMNLILSDVEETIMIVEPIEGALEGNETVKVSL